MTIDNLTTPSYMEYIDKKKYFNYLRGYKPFSSVEGKKIYDNITNNNSGKNYYGIDDLINKHIPLEDKDDKRFLSIFIKKAIEKGQKKRKIDNFFEYQHYLDTGFILGYFDKITKKLPAEVYAAAFAHDFIEETEILLETLLKDIKTEIDNIFTDQQIRDRYYSKLKITLKLIENLTDWTKVESCEEISEERYDYLAYLRNIFGIKTNPEKKINLNTTAIKLADRISQAYQQDYISNLNEPDRSRYYVKHSIINKHYNYLDLTKMIKNDPEFRKYYDYLEKPGLDFMFFIRSISKNFLTERYCIDALKDYDPLLINLRNFLVLNTIEKITKPRKKHFIEGNHLSKKNANKINKEIENNKKPGQLGYLEPFLLKDLNFSGRIEMESYISELRWDKYGQYRIIAAFEKRLLMDLESAFVISEGLDAGKLNMKDFHPISLDEGDK